MNDLGSRKRLCKMARKITPQGAEVVAIADAIDRAHAKEKATVVAEVETVQETEQPEDVAAVVAAVADGADASELVAISGEVETPLERLVAQEKVIAKGLNTYEKQFAAVEATKEQVGEALYTIYNDRLWKARRGKDGKALFKNFGEYLDSKGWGKTASRAYQLMADHRKVLKANNEPVVEAKRGPKPNNPGRSAQTMANSLIDLRNKMSLRADAMTADSQAETDFVGIVERFLEATAEFVSEFEQLADREQGAEKAE